MLEELKELVYTANTALPRYGLSIFTWGNASGIDRARGLVVIKPSGVAYDQMKSRDMVVVDLGITEEQAQQLAEQGRYQTIPVSNPRQEVQ